MEEIIILKQVFRKQPLKMVLNMKRMTLILLGTFCLSSLTQGMQGMNPLDGGKPDEIFNSDEVNLWTECAIVESYVEYLQNDEWVYMDSYLEYLQKNEWLIAEKTHERRKQLVAELEKQHKRRKPLVAELQKRLKQFERLRDSAHQPHLFDACTSYGSRKPAIDLRGRQQLLEKYRGVVREMLAGTQEEASKLGVSITYKVELSQ